MTTIPVPAELITGRITTWPRRPATPTPAEFERFRVPRVTVYHLTPCKRLPLIEEHGLRTRAELSSLLGPIGELDTAAPGKFANGKRVSGWLSKEHAGALTDELGAGLVTFDVDPSKAVANRASARQGDISAYWQTARPLTAWLEEGEAPDDLEVHQSLAVRAKRIQIHAPLVTDAQLEEFAPLVGAVADEDRLSAKALMHLAVIASAADFDSAAFTAACALAWRDEPDPDRLIRELVEMDPDKVASAALAEHGSIAPDAVARLRTALEETRVWAEQNSMDAGQGVFARTAVILDELADGAGR